MSYYDDEQPRRHRSHRHSRPVYEEEIIESRSSRQKPAQHMELVRRRDSDESIEEVRRDFPPGDGTYIQRRTTTRDRYPRARSMDRHSYHEDYYYDDARRSEPRVSRHSRRYERRYDSESEDESPPPRHRRKSLGEQALAAVGLGGAAHALSKKDRERDRSRSRDRDYDRSRSRGRRRDYDDYSPARSKSVDHKQKIAQAAKAAVTAGVIEAWRSRKEPGGFAGQGKRVLTAAIGAAGINGAIDRDPEHHKTRHTIEAALGGLAGNRLINGAREKSRSRSRARNPEKRGTDIGGIASAAGLAALAGKAFNDYRSRSRGREADRDDDGSPRRSRSRSISDYVTRGVDGAMAKLGLGNNDKNRDRDRERHYSSDDEYRARPRGGGGEEQHHSGSDSSSDDTDHYDSDKEEKKRKKMRNKTLLTGGLATVATIHAIANVHGSMEKGKERHKKLAEGKITEEQASKQKRKALLQDAASVGIAAIGIKSAVSELKELKEHRDEYKHTCERFSEKREHRRQKQLRQGPSRSDSDVSSYHHDQYYYDDNPYSSGAIPPPPMGYRGSHY